MLNENGNALEIKIDDLGNCYEEFASDESKRLLRWLIRPADLEIFDLFFRVQEEEISKIPDLFITFDVPFTGTESYPRDLRASLDEQYEQIRPDMAQVDIEAAWRCPPLRPGESPTSEFVRALESFQNYYKESIRNVVAVLRPGAMGELSEWQAWMRQLLSATPAKEVRSFVLEYQSHPLLSDLARDESGRVHTEGIDIDMPGLLKELAQGTEPGPAADFRVLFVTLGTEAADGNIEAAEKTAAKALAIATAGDWLQMQVVIHMSLGAAYLQAKDNGSALKTYKKALEISEEAVRRYDPAGPKLVIQCRFAEAAALVADGNYRKAADVYRIIPPLAEAENDPLMEMEGWRMTAFCHEKLEDYDSSVEYGELSIEAGEKLKEEDRPTSTLPYVGAGLIRVMGEERKKERKRLFSFKARGHRGYDSEDRVRQKMEELCGPDWEDSVAKVQDMPGGTST